MKCRYVDIAYTICPANGGEGVKVPQTTELMLCTVIVVIVIMYAADSHASACSSYVVTFI